MLLCVQPAIISINPRNNLRKDNSQLSFKHKLSDDEKSILKQFSLTALEAGAGIALAESSKWALRFAEQKGIFNHNASGFGQAFISLGYIAFCLAMIWQLGKIVIKAFKK